jgi:hypothetical protein
MKSLKFSISGYGAPPAFCLYGRNSKTHLFRVCWGHRQSSGQQFVGMNISFCTEVHVQHYEIHTNACLRSIFDVVISNTTASHWPSGIQVSTAGICYLPCLIDLFIRKVTNRGKTHQKALHIIRNIAIRKTM